MKKLTKIKDKKTFWIIQAQENPAEPRSQKGRKEWRSNTLSENLADRGHQVIRWRSAFSHNKKVMLSNGNSIQHFDNYYQQFINCIPYKNHIGLNRIINHKLLAKNFKKIARSLPKPNLIHTGNVPTELAFEAVKYGRSIGCPVIVDIRDLWPDAYLEHLPKIFRLFDSLSLYFIRNMSFKTRYSLAHASALTAITQPILDWGLQLGNRKSSKLDAVYHMCTKSVTNFTLPESKLKNLFQDGEDIINVLFMGNYGYQYNFDSILNTARFLNLKEKKICFIFAGSGPKLNYLKKNSQDLKNFCVLEWVNGQDLVYLLSKCHVGLLPYKNSKDFSFSFSNKFPEYLSYGLVCACGVEGEMSKLVNKHNCGFFYNTEDKRDLGVKLSRLVDDKNIIKNFSKNAISLHDMMFNSEVIFNKFANHLELISEIQKDEL